MKDLAVVTGAAGGIGFAIASALAREGWPLLICDLEPVITAKACKDLSEAGAAVEFVVGDVADTGFIERLLAAVGSRNVGALVPAAGLSTACGDEAAIFRVNYEGTIQVVRALRARLAGGGCIVLIGSVVAFMHPVSSAFAETLKKLDLSTDPAKVRAHVTSPNEAYAISKRAIVRLAEREAGALGAQGTRIVALSPGFVDAGMGRADAVQGRNSWIDELIAGMAVPRRGSAEEIGAAAAFLCSSAASYITGCELRVDGGFLNAFAE